MMSVVLLRCFRVPTNSVEESVSKLVRGEKQENYHRIVSAHPSYGQEFDRFVLLLNFVNAV